MAHYKLYAGLGGGFGGATYHGTYEFDDADEAERAAYNLAWEEYQSYEGNHGLLSWDEVYDDLLESEMIDPHSQTAAEIEAIVDEHYLETVESWLDWSIEEVDSYFFHDTDDDDDDYDDEDDDPDCFCD